MPTADKVIEVAESQVGYSRWDDPQTGTKYGRWYAGLTGEDWYGGNDIAYCAMFVSWVFSQARAKCAGLPGAYCPTMLDAAIRAGRTVKKSEAQRGDVVYFEWQGDDESDHVGIVVENCGSYYRTIEGNTSEDNGGSQTNGGVVARKVRSTSLVCGVVRPYYDEQPAKKLKVTGVLRDGDITEWQRQCGTYVDGVITGQCPYYKDLWPALEAIDEYDSSGSALIRRVQQIVGVPNPTGVMARGTICMIQGWLTLRGYDVGADEAGHLQEGTAKAIQASLNDQTWTMAGLRS